MRKQKLIQIANSLKLRYSEREESMSISCPLAYWTHDKKVDRKPSMAIYDINKRGPSHAHCFTCGFHGSITSLLTRYNKLSSYNIDDLIKLAREEEYKAVDFSEFDFDSFSAGPEKKKKEDNFSINTINNWRDNKHNYLTERNLTDNTIKSWKLGYDSYKEMVTVPVFSYKNVLVGAIGRSVQGKRYHNYWGFNKSSYLLGENLITSDNIIITEGTFDAPKLWQLLFSKNLLDKYSVLSTMGSKVSDEQLRRVVRFGEKVIIALDNDLAGRKGLQKSMWALKGQLPISTIKFPLGSKCNDIDDLVDNNPEQLISLLDKPTFLF